MIVVAEQLKQAMRMTKGIKILFSTHSQTIHWQDPLVICGEHLVHVMTLSFAALPLDLTLCAQVQHASVYTFKTFPCVPAPRAHVLTTIFETVKPHISNLKNRDHEKSTGMGSKQVTSKEFEFSNSVLSWRKLSRTSCGSKNLGKPSRSPDTGKPMEFVWKMYVEKTKIEILESKNYDGRNVRFQVAVSTWL